MKKIQTILEFILNDMKTTLKILIKAPTWRLRTQLITKALQNLKGNGENCLSFINEFQNKCNNIKMQINEIISIATNHLQVRRPMQVTSSFTWTIIDTIIKIAQIVVFNDRIISVTNEKSTKDNLTNRDLPNIREILQLSMLFEQQWDKIISLVSIFDLQLKLALDTQINTLIEQIQITNDNLITVSEQEYIIELIKVQLINLYKKLCSSKIMFEIYLHVLEKFIIEKIDEFSLIHSDEQQGEHSIVIDRPSCETNLIRTQLTQY